MTEPHSNGMRTITANEFVNALGSENNQIDERFLHKFNQYDFRYNVIEGEERLNVILELLKYMDDDTQKVASAGRIENWRKGWQENLDAFMADKDDLSTIVPKFIRPNKIIRYKQQYIQPYDPYFEKHFVELLQCWLFNKYMSAYDNIYEFGCGSGMNLIALARMFPNKHLTGVDFVEPAVKLAQEISAHYNFNISSRMFDMTHPDHKMTIKDNSCVLTFGVIEQLGGKFHDFIDYVIRQGPGLCIHIEALIELYDENNLADYLVIKFLRQRGYSQEFLTFLQTLEKKSLIEIVKIHRPQIGSLYLEGYNYIIWRPI